MTLVLIFIVYAIGLAAALARGGLQSVTTISAAPSGAPLTRVLIVGATGGTGRQLLAQALERGYVVTALVRVPGKLSVEHPHLTVVRGDVLDYFSVEKAVRGQDAVISALGHKRFFVPTRILSEGTRNVLRDGDSRRASVRLRDFSRHRGQRRAHGPLLLALCHSIHPALIFLGQDPAGTTDCGQQPGVGDRAARSVDERQNAGHLPLRPPHRQFLVDGSDRARRRGPFHAEATSG